jgi:hypothetical protein
MESPIYGMQTASFSVFDDTSDNKRKICPAIGDDMTDNCPPITLFGIRATDKVFPVITGLR